MRWTIDKRRKLLGDLCHQIEKREDEIFAALYADLHKSAAHSYMSEVGLVLREIRRTRRSMGGWLKDRRVRTPIFLFPAQSRIVREPYGEVLIIAPWNYPFQLLLLPLVGAVAAGNSVVVKASPDAAQTERVLKEIIEAVFEPEHVRMEFGGAEKIDELLARKWDYIFFTGSTSMGRVVARAAAERLTPVTLELGGKCPCVVSSSANLKIAARRIVWGKFLNAGQTCVAPDYVLCDQQILGRLVVHLREAILEQFGPNPQQSENYGRIVSQRAFDRLVALCPEAANDLSDRYIAPTVIELKDTNHPLMSGEIFGPILPVVGYQTVDEAIEYINEHDTPLSLYAFASSRQARHIVRSCPSGSACINETMEQLVNDELPFGGLGQSGMGAYHGRYSVETFSHRRSILSNSVSVDFKLRYNPMRYFKLIKKVIR